MDIRDALFDQIYDFAERDKDVVFITADTDAFSLHKFKEDFPDRFINVGVAEQAMVTVAAGLALSGKKVFIYAIIPFITMRVFEQIKATICSMNLPVTIIGAGAGLSFGYDGPTHHAIQDIGIMRMLPEMQIYNPFDAYTAADCALSSYHSGKPSYIRLDKGEYPNREYHLQDGICTDINNKNNRADIAIICTGTIYHTIKEIIPAFPKHVYLFNVLRLKPLTIDRLLGSLYNMSTILVFEENSRTGGLGTMLKETLIDKTQMTLKHYSLEDEQIFKYGTREYLLKKNSLDKESIYNILKEETGS